MTVSDYSIIPNTDIGQFARLSEAAGAQSPPDRYGIDGSLQIHHFLRSRRTFNALSSA